MDDPVKIVYSPLGCGDFSSSLLKLIVGFLNDKKQKSDPKQRLPFK